jgi:hypothetical protein
MISVKPVPKNVRSLIRDNLDPDSKTTEESDLHFEKHLSPKTSTDEGIMISIKPVLKNAFSSIRDNLDPDSKVTEESDPQSAKQFKPKNITETGTVIKLRKEFSNPSGSIRDNFETFSITIDLREFCLETLFDGMISMPEGSHNLLIIK